MAVKKIKESEASLELRKFVAAYELVIADIAQDVGWRRRAKERVLRALEHRLWELENIWDDILDNQ